MSFDLPLKPTVELIGWNPVDYREPQRAKFPLGFIFVTVSVAEVLGDFEIRRALVEHQEGSWGEVSPIDHQRNGNAIRRGEYVLSAKSYTDSPQIWVMTNGDRQATVLMLPEEYLYSSRKPQAIKKRATR